MDFILKKGDRVAIISPSRQIQKGDLDQAVNQLQQWGLHPEITPHVYAKDGYFAGSDEERRSDLQAVMDDPSVKAIFCSRGGYGMTRILDGIKFDGFQKNPKPVIGFSDITALHLNLAIYGATTIHGCMPVQFSKPEYAGSIEQQKHLLFNGVLNVQSEYNKYNRNGESTAPVIGGNLSLLADSLGTPNELESKYKILLIEEVDEYLYKIDRMLVQLKRAGKFDQLKGLIIGSFSDMKDTTIPFGESIEEIISSHVKEFDFPVVFGFPSGHVAPNYAIPFGPKLMLIVNAEGALLTLPEK